jgi:hypothetical protein
VPGGNAGLAVPLIQSGGAGGTGKRVIPGVMFKRILVAVVLSQRSRFGVVHLAQSRRAQSLDLGLHACQRAVGLAFVARARDRLADRLLSASIWVARISADRRRLRSELKKAQRPPRAWRFAG